VTVSALYQTCTACTTGAVCDGHSIVECKEGFTRTSAADGSNTCTLCPAGSKCPTKTAVTACDAQTFSAEGSSSCYESPAGYKVGRMDPSSDWAITNTDLQACSASGTQFKYSSAKSAACQCIGDNK
jgi:hypothetical protein